MSPKKRRCPTPWKQAHPTKADAVRHCNSLYGRYRKAAAGQHTYHCPCGSWHVGGARKRLGRKR